MLFNFLSINKVMGDEEHRPVVVVTDGEAK